MTLPNPLRITRALMSRINSVNPKPQTMSNLNSLQVQTKPSLDLKIDTQQIIASVFKQNVTVVIPTLNEAEAIREVIEEVRAEGYNNILVVDGYSTDRTDRIAFGNDVGLVYQHGIGKAGGVKTALEFAKTPFVLFMDGDGTYDPKDIWRLVNHTDHYAHVIGARIGAAWRMSDSLESAYLQYMKENQSLEILRRLGITVLDVRPERLFDTLAQEIHETTTKPAAGGSSLSYPM